MLLTLFALLFISTLQAQVNLSSVKIGNQTWMVKNLDVSHYRNGDSIPEVKDPSAWASLTTGAWCYFKNDPANGKVYSKLYNWYAVNDPRGLAPEGWHIPSDAEWTTLSTALGVDSVAGGKLKEAGNLHWTGSNSGADNSSGFTGLPGGNRLSEEFYNISNYGYWWSSSESDTTHAWCRYLTYFTKNLKRDYSHKRYGYSVRCIKD